MNQLPLITLEYTEFLKDVTAATVAYAVPHTISFIDAYMHRSLEFHPLRKTRARAEALREILDERLNSLSYNCSSLALSGLGFAAYLHQRSIYTLESLL